ncbi:uncharacterized protein LOC106876616 [Octopus bimaculoides]|uniref:uncharacterized protein LOC106876616 n=1 Tax=Octopus bimaculoides TaxID=37653 RepID=UPI00071D337C|nr:uncharacterized protein LOC106876616 [Octopus bimaculoides]|eukprot:XP_014780713.1 PREDICTED: uncharacterized protein LOC106876616 [Octopus bimaculoides]
MSPGQKFVPTLQHFILRGEVIRLYRQCLRTVYKMPKEQRPSMVVWINQEFLLNKNLQDPELIKMNITRGKTLLQKFKGSIQRTEVS